MLLNSNVCARIRETLPRHRKLFKILLFGLSNSRVYIEFSEKIGTYESGIHFLGHPFTYNALFSSWKSKFNPNPKLFLENGELGSKESKVLSYSGTSFDDIGEGFDDVHEFEESGNGLDCTEDDFMVWIHRCVEVVFDVVTQFSTFITGVICLSFSVVPVGFSSSRKSSYYLQDFEELFGDISSFLILNNGVLLCGLQH
ncbi:hypothetical protein T459_04497 [Capsicum annuum]|uniref:Uncharacterized protein n=1 Tax=Capsicum annuum TaxID=4072 RepID=A0A2G3A583_CAPAN|nr:hypothetical protein T459_04497 [Capsicum annuum]